jgi:D-xylose transport system substrate-binding protein
MLRRTFLRLTGSAAVAGMLPLAAVCRPEATWAAEANRIGFLLKTMQEERYQADKSFFIARAEAGGAQVLFDSGNNDELTQVQQFEAMLEAGARVIVLQPVDTATAGGLIDKAHARGVRVIGYDSMPAGTPPDLMVMQDSWAVGRLQGEAMLKWLIEKKGRVEGRVALLMGQPGDSNAAALSDGFLRLLEDQPRRLDLVEQRAHVNWSPDEARATAERLLLQYDNRVDAFVCNNDGLASGVIAALEAEGLADSGKVFVAGADADRRNIRWVAQGKQTVDVWKPLKPLAYQAADAALRLAQEPTRPVAEMFGNAQLIDNGTGKVPTIITPVTLVTKDNIDSTVIAAGHLTKEQIYGTDCEANLDCTPSEAGG